MISTHACLGPTLGGRSQPPPPSLLPPPAGSPLPAAETSERPQASPSPCEAHLQ